jgi:transposase
LGDFDGDGRADLVSGSNCCRNLLCRYHGGERKLWSVVNVPAVADEDRRQLHRSLKDLQRQQTECSNRMKGLLRRRGKNALEESEYVTGKRPAAGSVRAARINA